ncbi:MAG: hypothetical protein AAF098_13505 [Pseudomonadota bacterium]
MNVIKVTVAALLLSTANANAGLITFNLSGNSGDGAEGALLDGLSFGQITKAGVTASFASDVFGGNDDLVFNQTSSAFGINRVGDGCDNSAQFDNDCGSPAITEAIYIEFDVFATLVSITISSYSESEEATLIFENDSASMFESFDLPSSPSTLNIGAPIGAPGNRFSLGAFPTVTSTAFSFDSFTIQTREVSTPTTLALLSLGLLGLARRRRS